MNKLTASFMNQTSNYFGTKYHQQWLLLAVVGCNLMLLINELSTWLIALIALCFVWRIRLIKAQRKSANKWFLLSVALVGCILLAIRASGLGLLLSMVHLLCFAYTLKMLEIKRRKDFYQMVLIGLFLLASSLIFLQTLFFITLFSFVLVLNLALLYQYFSKETDLSHNYRQGFKLLLQSLPLAIALFLLFPKLSPFWQVPFAKSAKTGLSNTVSVGDVANLALSNELAFRVTFDDTPPSYQQMYWRTLVLDSFDGVSWRRASDQLTSDNLSSTRNTNRQSPVNESPFLPVLKGEATAYQVIAEPSFQHWLFTLDVANTHQQNITIKSDYSLVSSKLLTQNLSYQVTSYMDSSLDLDYPIDKQRLNTQLPQESNPKLKEEALRLRALYSNNRQLIAAVLRHFNQQPFRYTLQPPLLTGDRLDNFYFSTQAGFCEHYASTFAFIMRAANIPTRLVVGYMGGEYNQQGQFFTIRQRDAHAWTEVWLASEGWVRVDPTAAVSPERIELGFSTELFEEQSSLSGDLVNFYQISQVKWLNMLRLQLANMDYQWTKWVVGYNAKRQQDFLKSWFGKVKQWKSTVAIAVVLIATMLLLTWFLGRKNKPKPSLPWLALYENLLLQLAQKGLTKQSSVTASQFAEDVVEKFPAIEESFIAFSNGFVALQYQQLDQQQKQKIFLVMKIQYKRCIMALKSSKKL